MKLPTLALGVGRELAHAVKAGKLGELVPLFRHGDGDDCTTSLHRCPECDEGYLESHVVISIEIPPQDEDDEEQTLDDTWIIASRKLTAIDVKALARFQQDEE